MPEVTEAPTPEKLPDVAVPTKPTQEFLERAKIELETRLAVRQEYEQLFKIWKNDELIALEKRQEEIITKGLREYFDKWKEEQKPPEPEDIQQLLDQEYVTYTLPVDVIKDDDSISKETFVIRELPQSIEKKFYLSFKRNIMDKISEIEALVQAGVDRPFEEKVKAGLALFDESFEVLSEAVTLILNPFGRKNFVTKQWVQENISSDRQWRILEAQLKVNRLRDFLSKVSLSSQNLTMMKRPNFQALQQLAD